MSNLFFIIATGFVYDMFRKLIAINKDSVAKRISAINSGADNLFSLLKKGEIIITAPNQPADKFTKRSEIEERIDKLEINIPKY